MKIESIISNLNSELRELSAQHADLKSKIMWKTQELMKSISLFEDNWVGSWASDDFNHYRNVFNGSGDIVVLSEREIIEFLQKKVDISFSEIRDTVPLIAKPYRAFRDTIITELSLIKGLENHESEITILDKLENFQWGTTSIDYIKMRRPKTIFTYNPETILNKGLDTPPHIDVGADLISWFSTLASIEGFEKNCKRILRQLELKYSIEVSDNSSNEIVYRILNSFHIVANQLKNRYNKRVSLIINDEYDVQDLLHSLLKIAIDDVRPEEYTPSYAGSSARMDFLLRKESTVIEVKKTREGLKDREVGDQLILDVQHYKAHPNCKKLICFVYDPENRIVNPRGLESDLSEMSSDEMLVEILIRP